MVGGLQHSLYHTYLVYLTKTHAIQTEVKVHLTQSLVDLVTSPSRATHGDILHIHLRPNVLLLLEHEEI